MKTTTWLCPVLTLLCATRLVCTAQRSGIYPLDYADTNVIQNDYLLEKRNKPSLSIVNPLDVLRQRLLLEIARRQMKENTRQVELNRAILKNVGKRMLAVTGPYQSMLQQQQQLLQQHLQQQQPRQQLQLLHYPNQLDCMPAASIFDFLQRSAYATDALDAEEQQNSPLLDNGEDNSGTGLGHDNTKYQLNGNEIANETTNHNKNSNADNALTGSAGRRQAMLVDVKGAAGEEPLAAREATFDGEADHGAGEGADSGTPAYQMRYLQYRLHNNRRYTKNEVAEQGQYINI